MCFMQLPDEFCQYRLTNVRTFKDAKPSDGPWAFVGSYEFTFSKENEDGTTDTYECFDGFFTKIAEASELVYGPGRTAENPYYSEELGDFD